jgi:chromosome segregation ATPase
MAEYHGNNECVHYLMIVETCINLSIKVVRLSRRLRETKSNNEILKAQMDEAIAINNDFINQRENVMNISLDLMQRQINDLESKINYEIEKFNMENRNLREKLDILNSQLKSFTNSNDKLIEANNYSNAINNKNIVIQPNLEAVRHDLANTKQVCAKVIQMDQKKLDSIKSRFEEIKTNLDSSSSSQDIIKSKCSGNGNQVSSCDTDIIENKEHFEILRFLLIVQCFSY